MKRIMLLVFALAVVLGAGSARADQVTLGDSCTGTLQVPFISSGDVPTVTGTVTGCNATWEIDGTSTIVSPWSLTSGSVFDIGGGANAMAGTVTWTNYGLTGGITTLVGYLVPSSSTGFNSEYGVGGDYPIDITLYGGGVVSAGQIETPEPGTLVLMGTGLLAMAGLLRRRIF